MIATVPFKKEHLEIMAIRNHEDRLLQNANTLACLEGSISFTAVRDGRIVCCYGIVPYLRDLADIWLLPSVYAEEHAVEMARESKRFLSEMQKDLGIRRMETICLDDDLHNRWMTFLGFEKEGTKRQYIGSMDYNMWGRVWA